MQLPYQTEKQSNIFPINRKSFNSQKGFTLIEIIVTLLIVGILAAIGGMGIVQTVKGYMITKENSVTTQKAQLAMARITKEIVEMNDINANATSTLLTVRNVSQLDESKNLVGDRTIGLNNNAIKIAFGGNALADGDILIDNVSNLTFAYYSGNSTWTYGSNINMLSAIDVSMTLSKPNLTFTTRVCPRNNGNLGGANMPTVTPPIGPNYCFVATAAYGDPKHPMVQVLREFRDKYLISFSAGQWFIKQYYTYGPVAAELIRNRPWAMWVVRCLLAPVVTMIFCLMYVPVAIPFLFFIALIITSFIFSVYRRTFKSSSLIIRNRGSVLIALIITMVIMAALAAAMLPMFSSSYMNQVYADQGRKAYFLAESGFAYASSEYLNEKTNKDSKLAEINNKTCKLLDNAGSFTIVVYPLWTVSGTLSSTSLPTTVYGTIPDELKAKGNGSATIGYVNVGSNYYSYTSRTNPASDTITFAGISPTTGLTSGQDVMAVALAYGADGVTTSVTNGGDLRLKSTGSDTFPRLNGNFTINGTGKIYNYSQKDGDTLKNITLSDKSGSGTLFTVTSGPITTAATSKIVLEKFVRIQSTGTSGGASRTVKYNAPIGILAAGGRWEKKQDDDLPNDINNWTPLSGGSGFGGTHEIASIDGDNALKVKSTSSVGLWTYQWAVTIFQGYKNTNLAKAWLDAGGFLSYDVQTKVNNTEPYFLAGINLRSRNNASNNDLYTYGVSFARARDYCAVYSSLLGCTTGWYNSDDIDNDIISRSEIPALFNSPYEKERIPWTTAYYRYSRPAIIFWKRKNNGVGGGTTKWLAYRELTWADGIWNVSSSYPYLAPWATLLVRIAEGYSLTFTAGNTGTPIKEGDIIRSSGSSNWSARVVMTPILTSGSWAGNNAAGTLVLANINGTFASGDLSVNGTRRATTGAYTETKKNYIKVYYGSTGALGTANAVETDNNRLANPRGGVSGAVNWPPDDVTEITSSNDYFSLVTWTNTATDAATSFLPASGSSAKVIVDSDLLTPNVTSSSTVYDFSGDAPALVSGGSTATSTYYDDFAIQMDMAYGIGFLPPIQE